MLGWHRWRLKRGSSVYEDDDETLPMMLIEPGGFPSRYNFSSSTKPFWGICLGVVLFIFSSFFCFGW